MSFDEKTILSVWVKGKISKPNDEKIWRKDKCDAWIKFAAYGDRELKYGWEIDHITPVSKGGGDELSNLQPLHWENNVSKGDGDLTCAVTSNDNKNVAV